MKPLVRMLCLRFRRNNLKRQVVSFITLFVVTLMFMSFDGQFDLTAPRRDGPRPVDSGVTRKSLWRAWKGCDNPQDQPGQVHILLNAFMRSGSFFTGRLLGDIPSTFSFMEPLWKLTLFGYYTADNRLCETRWSYCRHLDRSVVEIKEIQKFVKSTESSDLLLETVYRILHDIYSCQLDDLRSLIDAQILYGQQQTRQTWVDYKNCHTSIRPCFPDLIKNCTGSKVRLTKVIRMSLAAARPLLEACSSLKVLQLVRDPRGTICSRLIKTKWYPLKSESHNYTAIAKNARTLCRRMTEDYQIGKQFMKSFPNRVKFIRYDDLVSGYRQSLWDNLTNFLGVEKMMLTEKFRDNPFEWRTLLDQSVIDIVDKECSYVYSEHGYIPLRPHELRNASVSSFIPNFDRISSS